MKSIYYFLLFALKPDTFSAYLFNITFKQKINLKTWIYFNKMTYWVNWIIISITFYPFG